ncbi:MAG: InlB B-repeat-containing protein, partial [Clostridia bacterium]|nr:InlB B-repeat-containing protein [Clostridia bacterium]
PGFSGFGNGSKKISADVQRDGDQVTVAFSASDFAGTAHGEMFIGYNADHLEFVYSEAQLVSDPYEAMPMSVVNNLEGVCIFAFAYMNVPEEETSGLVTLTFKAKVGAPDAVVYGFGDWDGSGLPAPGSCAIPEKYTEKYTVKYSANGGSGAPGSQTKTEGEPLKLSSAKPSKSYTITYDPAGGTVSPASKTVACTFKNWNTAKDGSKTTYEAGGSYDRDENVTLYAQWTNPKAGALSTPKKDGYSFAGWYTAARGGSEVTSSTEITKDTSLYAHWTALPSYTVSYDVNGGTGTPSSQKKTQGTSLTLRSDIPKKEFTISYNAAGGSVTPSSKSVACTFKNWNTAKDGSKTTYEAGGSYKKDADVTLYAQWTNPRAGTLPTPKKGGYTFAGWYTQEKGGSKVTSASEITKNTTLYAHWTAEDIYNIGEESYRFGNYSDDHANGHCFGMSMTSSGYYLGILDFSLIGGNKNSVLYSFTDSSQVRSVICNYQAIQGTYANDSIVAGGKFYLSYGKESDIASDWKAVVDYVKDHKYDGAGSLQIGFRQNASGGHAVNFLRYEKVDGQDRIYAYDNNYPTKETYFYSESGKVYQAPVGTFSGALDCIALRNVKKYFSLAGNYDTARVVYSVVDNIEIEGLNGYAMEGRIDGKEYMMYEIPYDVQKVVLRPLVDNADFIYKDTEFGFGSIDDDTYGVINLPGMDDESAGQDSFSFEIHDAPEQSAVLPEITTQPKNANGTNGSTVEFTVSAARATSYQWQVSADGGRTWSNSVIPGSRTGKLVISVTDEVFRILFRCAVTNDSGTTYSDTVRVVTESKEFIPGDVDGSGAVLADDARLALRSSAKLENLDENQFKAADVNEDGQVLADDARQILRYSAKLQREFEKKR